MDNITVFSDGTRDATSALQKLLDGRGYIYLPQGRYIISKPLVIRGGTCLSLAPQATVRLADGANCMMLITDHTAENRDITVEGGVWDGNCSMQARCYDPEKYFYGTALQFLNTFDLTVRNLTVKDPEAFAIQIADAERFTVENITFDFNMMKPNMDGVHVQGRARNGFIRNIKGATNDDMVALNCDDGLNGKVYSGDIENIEVDGVFAENGYTAVRLLSCGSRMRNVKISNIFGTYRFNGVSFTHHNIIPGAPVWFDNITLDGIYASKAQQTYETEYDRNARDSTDEAYGEGVNDWAVRTQSIIWFAPGVKCGNVTLRDIHRLEEAQTEAVTIDIDTDVEIERLYIDDATQRFVNCPEIPLIRNRGEVKKLITNAID
ncbi:MAG: hypothetical protein GX897_05615 [Clostridiales bacterium]|nr:hypothetical protein [Clostridiales bacterium]